MCNKHLEQMVCHLVEFIYAFDVCAHNSLLFFENSDCPVHFYIKQFVKVKALQGGWNFIFSFLVENNLESLSVVIYLK